MRTFEPGLYAACFAVAATISFFLTPLVRLLSLRLGLLDAPSSAVKTHTTPTPIFGGVAIWAGFVGAMLLLRFSTNFPTGTLYNLRSLVFGGTLVFLLGLVDDLKRPEGLDYKPKFLVQFLATALLILFGLRVRFIHPSWVAAGITAVWVVGVTNSLNIIDIMDGLAASQAMIAAVCFLLVSLPSEEHYVNFAAAAIAGAALGFLPWNLSKRHKVFMGDCGSLTLGFLLAGVSLGARYSDVNDAGVFAPLLILFIPVFDTFFVSILRLNQGKSPFLGSKDHFALRLEKLGWTRLQVVAGAAAAAGFMGFTAFLATQYPLKAALALYALVAAVVFWVGRRLSLISMK
ncbi:MAG: undecaprenyl/decaprenyl-phosphate alpha-N-acetylglucosaminyl 1-phosphate transferase [Elusimicrobia bacterium]|nr:undecaprenyl/decaprenyl-phosphate alpha-N-acetylglucosaminyl 1-phosphate transferase [Elusimicrobiota bacterium]